MKVNYEKIFNEVKYKYVYLNEGGRNYLYQRPEDFDDQNKINEHCCVVYCTN